MIRRKKRSNTIFVILGIVIIACGLAMNFAAELHTEEITGTVVNKEIVYDGK